MTHIKRFCEQYGIPLCAHSMNAPYLYTKNCPQVGSLESKHVANCVLIIYVLCLTEYIILSYFYNVKFKITLSNNKVRELIAVKVLHTSLLNPTVVGFKVLPLGSYAPMPAPSPPLKTILELVLWNGLQSCSCITPDVINVIKMPSFKYFLYLR